jgi:hypothetical protein
MTLDNEHLNKLFIFASTLSIFGTVLVILTYLKFPKLRQYRHVELTFYIAINDLCAAVAVGVGKVRSESPACWFQSMGTSYSFLASVFWSAVVTYQIYIIVHRGRILEDLTNYHRFCWIFPLVVVILPFSTNNYGQGTSSWCFLGDREDSPEKAIYVWELLSFFVWLWLAIVFIVFVFALIILRLRDVDTVEAMTAYRPLYRLAAVPAVLIFCWTLPSFLILYGSIFQSSYKGPGTNPIHTMSAVLPPLQGFLMSVSFFIVNKSARDEWKAHLLRYGPPRLTPKNQFDTSRTSIGSSSFVTMSVDMDSEQSNSNSLSGHTVQDITSSGQVSAAGPNSISSNVRPADNAWLSRAFGSKQSVRSLGSAVNSNAGGGNMPHFNSQFGPPNLDPNNVDRHSIMRTNLADRDSVFERGSESYWTSPSMSQLQGSRTSTGIQNSTSGTLRTSQPKSASTPTMTMNELHVELNESMAQGGTDNDSL